MKLRTDIQALRGLAVSLVLLNHAQRRLFQSGFLGVDIFFVISGFLITGLVAQRVDAGTFSFAEFYLRRAKRLLPAAYVVLLATALVAPLILLPAEYRDYLAQHLGALTFTGNFALWRQAGYFDGAAGLKPLLHLWSLSLEEQYYLLLPAGLVLLPRRLWRLGAAAVLAASLALYFSQSATAPTASFYLLPARAWELAVGSLAALGAFGGATAQAILAGLFWPALALLFVVPALPAATLPAGVALIAVCAATLVVILRRHDLLRAHPLARGFAFVGGFSYSLYLVHWPLFAFANNIWLREIPRGPRLGLLAAAVALGYLLFRFVESPIHNRDLLPSRRLLGAAAAASLAVALVPFAFAAARPARPNYAQIRRINYGFSAACEYEAAFAPKKECRNADDPRVLVWGDSFAMHLVPGLAAVTDAGVIQATRSMCAPFLDLALIVPPAYPRGWAEQCLAFNRSVLAYLKGARSVEVVVLSSPFTPYLVPAPDGGVRLLSQGSDGRLTEQAPSLARGIEATRTTVAALTALGKRVLLVAPPPASDFDIGLCLERRASGVPFLGVGRDCGIPRADYERLRAPLLEFLGRLPAAAGVEVARFDGLLCTATTCAAERDGTFIYRDQGHLSYDGSTLVAKGIGLGARLGLGRPGPPRPATP